MKKHTAKVIAMIGLLVIIDQGIKLLISRYSTDAVIEIIPNLILFKPVHNTDLSWLGSLGIKLFASYYFSIGLNLILFVLCITMYRYIDSQLGKRGLLVQSTFICLFAGIVCSTIDRVIWKGSLDYIRLEGLFTFDLKDCYITVFEILFIYGYIRYHKEWDRFRFRDYVFSFLKKE